MFSQTQTLTLTAVIPLDVDGLSLGSSAATRKVFKNTGDGWKWGRKLIKCDYSTLLELFINSGWDIQAASLTCTTVICGEKNSTKTKVI